MYHDRRNNQQQLVHTKLGLEVKLDKAGFWDLCECSAARPFVYQRETQKTAWRIDLFKYIYVNDGVKETVIEKKGKKGIEMRYWANNSEQWMFPLIGRVVLTLLCFQLQC